MMRGVRTTQYEELSEEQILAARRRRQRELQRCALLCRHFRASPALLFAGSLWRGWVSVQPDRGQWRCGTAGAAVSICVYVGKEAWRLGWRFQPLPEGHGASCILLCYWLHP